MWLQWLVRVLMLCGAGVPCTVAWAATEATGPPLGWNSWLSTAPVSRCRRARRGIAFGLSRTIHMRPPQGRSSSHTA